MTDVRNAIVYGLKWMVSNQPQIFYSEASNRMEGITHPWALPLFGDCSSTPLNIWAWLGCEDPTKANPPYSTADTETWANAGIPVGSPADAIAADAVIYGLGGPIGVQHMAIVVTPGPDPMTVSHGWSGQPAYVAAAAGDPTDGAYGPPRFFRYNTESVNPVNYPPGYKANVKPGSPASKINPKLIPVGEPPTLRRGMWQPLAWIRLARVLGVAAGVWPKYRPIGPGGFGLLTERMVMRFENEEGLAPDGQITPRVWEAFGLVI